MVNSLEFLFSTESCSKCFRSVFICFGQILFNLAHLFAAHHEKSFVPAVLKVSIDYILDNLGFGKRNYCFGKKFGKSLVSWIQKSVRTLSQD